MSSSFDKVDFSWFWAKRIPTDVLTSIRWVPVNAGEKSIFRIIGQARSSFHFCVLKSVYTKTDNPALCTFQVNTGE